MIFKFQTDPRIREHGFIAGCGHSGTTLIANILSTHSELYVPLRETRMFMRGVFKQKRRYRQMVAEAQALGRDHVIEKTPRHIERLEVIRTAIPGARFIFPTRDGRDVVGSLYKRYGDLDAGIARWVGAMEIIRANRDRSDVLVYRHEDLVAEPARELQRICAHLDIAWDPELLNYHLKPQNWHGLKAVAKTDKRTGKHHGQRRNWQVNQPFFDSSGKWKEVLSEDQLTPITSGPGAELMREFGYL